MEVTTPFETSETEAQKSQWFDGENVIHATVEKLKKIETHEEASLLVDSLNDTGAYYQFVLGGVLVEIQKRGWTDHGEFYAHVEERHGIKKRKAQYLMSVFSAIVVLDIPWTDAKDVGWSNLRILSPYLTADNVGEWLAKAKGKTHAEVLVMLDEFKASGTVPTNPFDDGTKSKFKTLKFDVTDDMSTTVDLAIEKAMKEGTTDSEGQALEYMSMDFLAGGKKETPSLGDMFQAMKDSADSDQVATDVIMQAFCAVFPAAHVEVTFQSDHEDAPVAGEAVA